jgi:hypothetical protein
MRKHIGIAMGACLALSIGLSILALGAQKREGKTGGQEKKVKPISAEDQQAIAELFKDVDPSKYRLQFNEGNRVLGNKKVEMSDIEQVKRIRTPTNATGYFTFIASGRGAKEVVYIYSTEPSGLVSLLGREKTARLEQIMAKYAR